MPLYESCVWAFVLRITARKNAENLSGQSGIRTQATWVQAKRAPANTNRPVGADLFFTGARSGSSSIPTADHIIVAVGFCTIAVCGQ